MKMLILIISLHIPAMQVNAQTWQSRVAGFSYSLNGGHVYAVDDQVAWATGHEWDGNGRTYEHTGISRTTTAGNGWESVTFPTAERAFLINLAALDAMRVWALITINPEDDDPTFRIYKTDNGGLSWDTQAVFLPTYPALMHMWDENTGVVLSDPDPDGFRIRRTIDGGNTWTPVGNLPPALFGEYLPFATFAVQNDDIFAPTILGRILHSPDRGLTWSVIESPVSNFSPFTIDVNDEGQLFVVYHDEFAVHGDTRIFRKQLPNAPWVNISDLVTTYYPYTLKAIPGSDFLVFTTYDLVDQYWLTRVSNDLGESWLTIDSTSNTTYADFYNATTGYSSQQDFTGGTTRINRYIGSPLTGLFNQKPLEHASLLIAPNPGTTTSHVTFETKTTDDYLVLIHDVQGHLMYKREYHNTSNVTENIDIVAWPAGLYTLTVTSERGMITSVIYKL